MSNRYVVWSTHVPEVGEPFDMAEVTRTDKSVAHQDAAIFREIFHRKSWVQDRDVEDVRP